MENLRINVPQFFSGVVMQPRFAFQIVASLLIVGALLLLTGPKYDAAPLLPERWPTERERLVKEGGGNAKSEEAVKRGLAWLAEQQKKDGSWEFDGVSKDKIAATGLALLPFLAAGEMDHPVRGGGIYRGEYQKCVAGGIKWLMSKMYADESANQGGFFDTTSMYSQAIGTIALSEFAGRAHNPKAAAKAKLAVEFILRAQGRNGSWGYTGTQPSEGDTSIVGWQIEAIHAAERAGINVRNRDKAYQKASAFLESVSSDSGSKYGYRAKGGTPTLSAVGLLSRYYMKEMSPRHPAFARGVDYLKQVQPPQKNNFDMYYYYYATQVMFRRGGDDWHRFWNPKMRRLFDWMAGNRQRQKSNRFLAQGSGTHRLDVRQTRNHRLCTVDT